MADVIQRYYQLTKPGIVRGNLIAVIGGFLLASRGSIEPEPFLGVVAGTGLIIAAACVMNNIYDRPIDARMQRTHHRALVAGSISLAAAVWYAAGLAAIGFALLALYTNWLAVLTGIIGIIFYVFVYGYAKRRTPHSTLIGTISGAMPPVAGYVAVSGAFDAASLILFLGMAAWQMPHFYAIALFRKDEYQSAELPILPLAKGESRTKREILWYAAAFTAIAPLLTILGYTGLTYGLTMLALGGAWLLVIIRKAPGATTATWARSVFGISLILLLSWNLLLGLNAFLP